MNLSMYTGYPSFQGIKARIKEPYDYTGRGYRTDSDKRSVPGDHLSGRGKQDFD